MEETLSDETSKDANQLTTFSNDNLVEVESRKLIKDSSKLLICLTILATLFFIMMMIFIILYSINKPKICTSQECLRTASNYRSSMNESVDPCDNFYEFVCGRWSELHPNNGWWKRSIDSISTIANKIAIDSINILSEEINDNEPEAVKKSKYFYESCLDTETLDKLGIAAIYPFLEKVNLPTVPSFMTARKNSEFNWMLTETLTKQILQMDIFIGHSITVNRFNTSQNVLYIGQGIHKSPLQRQTTVTWKMIQLFDDNKDNDTAKELARNANIDLIMYVINEIILNQTGKEAVGDLLKEAADVIMEMSDFIDEIVTNTTEPNQQLEDMFTITVENLQNEIDDYLKKPNHNFLTTYFSYLFNGTNITINPTTDHIHVTKSDVHFLKRIIDYLAELPDVNIELYMWWRTVSAMMFNTSSNITHYILNQFKVFTGNYTNNVSPPKSVTCISLLTENKGFLKYAISYAIADRSFSNDTKAKIENMMVELKEAFLSNVKDLTWIDAKTKNAIFEKVKEMFTHVGYPNWLFEKGELDKYYKNIIIKPDTFLENMVNIITSEAKQNINSLRQVNERDEWDGNPVNANAHYQLTNSLDISMAIINFPNYNLGLEALNYGAIGSILGHEMIHGFDNTCRKFDKYGNFKQWWTNETIKNYENLTDCFVNQYENIKFTIPGVKDHVDGKRTLGENLADNGGLNQAFNAYTNYLSKYGEELKLPGFENYSNHQLFFIVYANVWCGTINTIDLKQLLDDVHSPDFIRVLGTLQNSENFANAFQCPKGSPMNPIKKCKIW